MGARVRVISIILSFTTPFVVSEGVHTYLLLGDGSGLSLHDSMTVGFTTGETIVARGVSTGIGVVVSGTAAPVRHRVINHEPVIATSLLSPAQYGAAYLVPIVASDAGGRGYHDRVRSHTDPQLHRPDNGRGNRSRRAGGYERGRRSRRRSGDGRRHRDRDGRLVDRPDFDDRRGSGPDVHRPGLHSIFDNLTTSPGLYRLPTTDHRSPTP